MANATVRPAEAAHFGKLAADWWDPKGSSAMLHRLNPVRLGFIRGAIDRHWPDAALCRHPLEGKRALDVGCGAGLLCEPLARLGAAVTGIDAAAENVDAARAHAAGAGLLSRPNPSPEEGGLIRYVHGDVAHLDLGRFDLVTALEVIEHVADKPAFLGALAAALAPSGLMVLSTPNRTPRSRLLMVEAAERLGAIPRGTHDWHDFVTPDELRGLLAGAGMTMGEPRGISWSPGKGLHLTDSMALNYIVTATGGRG